MEQGPPRIPGGDSEFWGRLAPPEREAMRKSGVIQDLAPGTVICYQGEPSRHVYVVLTGNVRVTAIAADGRQTLLAVRGPGAIIGELAAVDGRPRSATLVTMDTVCLLKVPAKLFPALCQQFPHIAWSLLNVVVARLRDTDRQRVEFGGGSITHRVCALLLDLAARHGARTDRGVVITTPVTQQELASSVAASRESVARVLHDLREHGIIETARRRITILLPAELRKWADST